MAITKVTKGVLGDGVIDNSKIAANTITTNQLHSTFTLDGVTEGASELYFTTARANSAIDSRVNNTHLYILLTQHRLASQHQQQRQQPTMSTQHR